MVIQLEVQKKCSPLQLFYIYFSSQHLKLKNIYTLIKFYFLSTLSTHQPTVTKKFSIVKIKLKDLFSKSGGV